MAFESLIQALQNPKIYPHPVSLIKVIETHLSWVILTGRFAYKIKKPVNLGFADFSSLKKRRFFCLEEFRLNQPLAQKLYIDVVPIFDKEKIIEYAVKMHQFDRSHSLLRVLTNKTNQEINKIEVLQKLAKLLADFHVAAKKVSLKSAFGTPELIRKDAFDNFSFFHQVVKNKKAKNTIAILENWTMQEFQKLKPVFQKRKQTKFIRDVHGDLHLGNIVFLEKNKKAANPFLIFDRIDFNPGFRCIDVINDLAFLVMDCLSKQLQSEAFILINHYLTATGDYEGMTLLKFYMVYRAMVRAKVALLTNHNELDAHFLNYIELAASIIKKPQPQLMITSGVSGSGKTYSTDILYPKIPAIRIRSDVERKRLFPKLKEPQLYSAECTRITFDKLANTSVLLLNAGWNVIVDAAFLQRKGRDRFKNIAKSLKVPFSILLFEVDIETAKKRIRKRLKEKKDASDATVEVLKSQLINQEKLGKDEIMYSYIVKFE